MAIKNATMEQTTWRTLLVVLAVLIPGIFSTDTIEPMEPIAATYSEPFNITCMATITSVWEGVRLQQVLPAGVSKTIYMILPGGGEDPALDKLKYSVTRIGDHGFSITVKSPLLEDAKRYRCTLIVYDNIAEKTTVAILRAPTVHGKDNIIVGERVQFTCDAQYQVPWDLDLVAEADLYPRITATIGGTEQTGLVTRYPEGRITLTWNVTSLSELDDQKDLVCKAYTIEPPHSIEKAKKLNIMYKVQKISMLPRLDVYAVEEKINCSARGNPTPRTRWEAIKTKAGSNVGSELLIVASMIGDPLEEWKCIASNLIAGKLEQIDESISFTVVKATEPPSSEIKESPTAAIAAGATVGSVVFIIALILIIILILRRRRQAPSTPPEEPIATGPFSGTPPDIVLSDKLPPADMDKPIPAIRTSKPNSNGQNVGFAPSICSPNVDDRQAELARRAITPLPKDNTRDEARDRKDREQPLLADLTAHVAPPGGTPSYGYSGYSYQGVPAKDSPPLENAGYVDQRGPPTPPTPTDYPDMAAAHPGLQHVYAKLTPISHEPLNTEV